MFSHALTKIYQICWLDTEVKWPHTQCYIQGLQQPWYDQTYSQLCTQQIKEITYTMLVDQAWVAWGQQTGESLIGKP